MGGLRRLGRALRTPTGIVVLTEVEITEPGLYLDVAPGIAEPLADAVARRL